MFDIAVLARTDVTGPALVDGEMEWTGRAVAALGTDEVVVQAVNRLPLAVCHAILRDARLLWARVPERAADFAARTLKEYFDLKPHLDRYDRELLRQAATGRLR